MAAEPTSGDLSRISLDGFHYQIVDSTVPSWAKQSTKPTYNGSEVNYTGTTGSTVTTNTTLNTAVQALDTAVNNRLKYVLLSQSEYDSLATKDSGTLYLIREVKYTITITGSPTSVLSDISVNGELKTVSNFPLEVNEGSSLYFVNVAAAYSVSVTMGGELITTVDGGNNYQLADITGDVVLNIYNGSSVD